MTPQAPVSEHPATGPDEVEAVDGASPSAARELQADRDVGEQPFHSSRLSARRPTASELLVAIAAIVAAAAAAAVVLSARAISNPDGYAFVLALNVLVFVFAGLAWRRARPWSPYGHALIAFGLASSLYSLGASSQPLAFSIGVLLTIPGAFFVWWLILAFPSGRLDGAGRAVLALSGGVLLLGCLPKTLLATSMSPIAPLALCKGACPTNPLQIGNDTSLGHLALRVDIAGTAAVCALIVALLAVRFGRASRPRRRLLAPVYLFSGLLLVASGSYQVAVSWLNASPAASDPLGFGVTATSILFPLGFIASIVLAYAYVGTALGAMVRELGVSSSIVSVERVVRQALDDPAARLAFWLPRARRYVDRHGHQVVLDENDQSTWRSVERTDGEPMLAIVHDTALDEDPELIEAVGAETVLALENRRLQQDLLDSIAALRASRKRLVAVAAAERRKIERDLHDSAQQMLIAIRIQLELTRGQADSRPDRAYRRVTLAAGSA